MAGGTIMFFLSFKCAMQKNRYSCSLFPLSRSIWSVESELYIHLIYCEGPLIYLYLPPVVRIPSAPRPTQSLLIPSQRPPATPTS